MASEIGYFQKQSFIDYPGKISCVLFLSGCNFKCPYCHNPSMVGCGGGCVDMDEIMTYLGYRGDLIDGVVVSGGEPTLHKNLYEMCGKIKDAGYPVKLDTNGSHPDVLKRLLAAGFVDYFAMDIKTTPDKYKKHVGYSGARIPESVRLIIESGIPHEFRTTCVRPMVDGNIKDIGRLIEGADLYVLQGMRPGVMLDGSFLVNDDQLYSDVDLDKLWLEVSPFVKNCVIR